MQCETVRVVSPVSDENPLGYIVINESDLAEGHELFVEPAAVPVSNDGDKPAAKKGAK